MEDYYGTDVCMSCDGYLLEKLALEDEVDRLKEFIDSLQIRVMHPHMDGAHQFTVKRRGNLTPDEWAIVLGCRPC